MKVEGAFQECSLSPMLCCMLVQVRTSFVLCSELIVQLL